MKFYDSESTFSYEEFLRFMLDELAFAFKEMERRGSLPAGIKIKMHNKDFKPEECPDCRELHEAQIEEGKSIFTPWSHCLKCLPVITQTKLSPCIVLQWMGPNAEDDSQPPTVVTIDLITILPVTECNTLELYKGVLTSLMAEKPPGWINVFRGYFSRDRILGDDFQDVMDASQNTDEDAKEPNWISSKLLSFGPHPNNYAVRPGQSVQVHKFQKENVREAYLILKGLCKRLDIDVPSYMCKKTLTGLSGSQTSTMSGLGIAFNAMISPELRPEFIKKIDIGALGESAFGKADPDTIPLNDS
jgi:hypothetical protein